MQNTCTVMYIVYLVILAAIVVKVKCHFFSILSQTLLEFEYDGVSQHLSQIADSMLLGIIEPHHLQVS